MSQIHQITEIFGKFVLTNSIVTYILTLLVAGILIIHGLSNWIKYEKTDIELKEHELELRKKELSVKINKVNAGMRPLKWTIS